MRLHDPLGVHPNLVRVLTEMFTRQIPQNLKSATAKITGIIYNYGISSSNYVFFVLELSLVIFLAVCNDRLSMAPFNRAWAQAKGFHADPICTDPIQKFPTQGLTAPYKP